MAKDPCKSTITKRLAWLVEQLVVSNREFSFILFLESISKLFYHFLHFFHQPLSSSLFHLFFVFKTTSYFVFILPFLLPSPPITSGFIFFFFISFFNKEELVNNRRE